MGRNKKIKTKKNQINIIIFTNNKLKKITIGFSPCPNDTFIFDALVNRRIDTGNFIFEPVMADVEQLNSMALESKLDITKISIGAYASVSENYIILDSGSALEKGVGPLLVVESFR